MDLHTHVLIATAQTFPDPSADPAPPGCSYEIEAGMWIVDDTGEPLMTASSTSRPRPPSTKKGDVETGEDMKGH